MSYKAVRSIEALPPAVVQASVIQEIEKPASPRFYRPELDAMRFFAFVAVFFHHVRWNYDTPITTVAASTGVPTLINMLKTSLSAGVSLFFFLSSYLITTLLVKELERTGTVQIPAFYLRRLLRIWPLYFAYMLLVVLLGLIFPKTRMHVQEAISYVLFLGNWYVVRHGWETATLVGMLWSISVEEQFYLVAPVTVKFFKERGLRWFSVACVGISVSVIVWLGFLGRTSDNATRPNSLVQMLFLVAGTLTALAIRDRTWKAPWIVRLCMALAGVSCWFVGYWQFGPLSRPRPLAPLFDYTLVLAGVLLVFFAFLGMSARRLPAPLVYLGKISYGLYIFHILALWSVAQVWVLPRGHQVMVFVRSVPSFVLTVMLAAASYRFLEKPFLQFKDRFTRIDSRPA
jgi:peptidoglycan/LPS O-acetylase OafA/YrhL